ncbi:MAG: response regulator transcription factor [Cyanobacteria bacterium HKST-UBA03]|nr:response regulator transcription factor [Cyanobacteria bacterium HKST-UBA03]
MPQSSPSKPLRVVVVEDHELSRNGIVVSLEQKCPDLQVVGTAEQGDQACQCIADTCPDVVLMDIGLPVMDGITATRHLKQAQPEVKVIMLTSHDDQREVLAAFAAGAEEYCKKDIKTERLIQVIQMVADGALWIDPAIAQTVLDVLGVAGVAGGMAKGGPSSQASSASFSACGDDEKPPVPLTDREVEILQAIVEGMNNQDIATYLNITVHTVKVHVRNIIDKLSVSDRTQAAVKGLRYGIVNLKPLS